MDILPPAMLLKGAEDYLDVALDAHPLLDNMSATEKFKNRSTKFPIYFFLATVLNCL